MSVNSPLDIYHDLRYRLWNMESRLRTLEKGGTGAAISGVAHIGEAIDPPTAAPTTGGGFLYVQNGALWFRGSAGTATLIGPA
jgi:hypothetical protein